MTNRAIISSAVVFTPFLPAASYADTQWVDTSVDSRLGAHTLQSDEVQLAGFQVISSGDAYEIAEMDRSQ
ncbi:hypothetical protein SAMN04488515_1796 [Cognatiyoonia koreensis]|uniref:Uncharacterized protein n=1 Tax=Cognatiyoonia koreensis TaxID=364200 RepID=A0A1I0QBJ8_9RHOB|nr:hypothetical protein [Cognatiyoonia koreensis]SEW24289.1 hypothetical protein SAMN04488515_1796 [Cognatiyoonia koreensis]